MKVGINEATELLTLAHDREISFANLLRAFAMEDLLARIYSSPYREYLWLGNDHLLQESSFKKGAEERLLFYYKADKKWMGGERAVPGQPMTEALLTHFYEQVLKPGNGTGVAWSMTYRMDALKASLELTAEYKEMQVPFRMEVAGILMAYQRPEKREKELWTLPGKKLEYLLYSTENQMGKDLFDILERLELIGDMGAYYRTYRILKSQPLSGRRLLEELEARTERLPGVKKERRLTQLKEYRSYSYMRKRWDQYVKRNAAEQVQWEEALELILEMAEPVWLALCREEVFLEDWMPEIGRFM